MNTRTITRTKQSFILKIHSVTILLYIFLINHYTFIIWIFIDKLSYILIFIKSNLIIDCDYRLNIFIVARDLSYRRDDSF